MQHISLQTNGLAAVNVARPSRWGNPFRIAELGRERAITLFEEHLAKTDLHSGLSILRGKNLACWVCSWRVLPR
ncbi:MAG: DUF4326 domain-containing protein [Rhizomicrobium sp.]